MNTNPTNPSKKKKIFPLINFSFHIKTQIVHIKFHTSKTKLPQNYIKKKTKTFLFTRFFLLLNLRNPTLC